MGRKLCLHWGPRALLLQHPGVPGGSSGASRPASDEALTIWVTSPGGSDGAVRPRVICPESLTLEVELGQNLRQELIKR